MFPRFYVRRALEENTYDHITATYFLLAERKLRSTRLGVKTPTRGRKQILAQPPRVAPGAQATTGATTTTSADPHVTGCMISRIGAEKAAGPVTLPDSPRAKTSSAATVATASETAKFPSASTHLNNNNNKVHIKDGSNGYRDNNTSCSNNSTGLEAVVDNARPALMQSTFWTPMSTGSCVAGNTAVDNALSSTGGNSLDALMIPARLARKCSIVREGEEDEAGASPGPSPKISAATIPVATVSIKLINGEIMWSKQSF